jgi:hypothetical protein
MYQTPPLYMAIHIAGGVLAYFYPILLLLFVAYQMLQLSLNIRFFAFTMEIREGNSILYTLYKIAQFLLGYGIAASIASFRSRSNHRPS